MEAATKERPTGLDPDLVKEQAAEIAEDDGLGDAPVPEPKSSPSQAEIDDPNSEHNTGVPGGRQPGDDGYVDPDFDPTDPVDPPTDPPPAAEEPPTPPAALPNDGEGDEDDAEAPQLFITGERQIGVKVGGRKPDTSVLKLKGTKIDLGGQFDRGDRLIAVATLQVTGDNDQDTIEKASGEVKATSKVQSATLCGFARLEEYLADRIEDKDLLNRVLEQLDLVEA